MLVPIDISPLDKRCSKMGRLDNKRDSFQPRRFLKVYQALNLYYDGPKGL
jgi:hypothetical protein